MAESILKKDLNEKYFGDSREDVVITLNRKIAWYTGTNEKPLSDTYDLVTVCLHELYHGLLMTSGNLKVTRIKNSTEYEGRFLSTVQRRFDIFLATETNIGDCSILSFADSPKNLGLAVTGNNLWFEGMQRKRVGKLFAPPVFTSGSSVYHLSEFKYGGDTNENNLMTPRIPPKFAQHKLGPIVQKMQQLMLDRNETGAPMCNKTAQPLRLERVITGRNNTNGESKPTNCAIRNGDTCLSIWVLVGAGVGAAVLVLVTGLAVCAIVRRKPKEVARPPRRIQKQSDLRLEELDNSEQLI